MKRILPFIYYFFTIISFGQTTVNYNESFAVIANPERGLQKYTITDENYNSTQNYSNIDSAEITNWRTGNEKITVILRCFLLNDFFFSPISDNYLTNIQKDFDIIREAGLKCIIRFSYSDKISTDIQQPTKELILIHLKQIASLLETNKDIIVTHQAGFIGTYGEWYYTNSTEFGSEGDISSTQWENRKEVLEAMLSTTPITIPIQVRYPLIKKKLCQNTSLTPLTAYHDTPLARIGFFNDGFLNDYGDQGTYEVSSQFENPFNTADYIYLSNETKYTPMSGETNGLNPPRTNGDNALIELDATNWSFLSRDYYEPIITNWADSGYLATMTKKLGYRFVLQNSTFNINNTTLSVKINLKNIGFARPFKKRIVYLVLRNNSTYLTYSFALDTDIRNWENLIHINQNFSLEDLPSGQYSSYLYLPDSESNIQNTSAYSIQMANTNCWNDDTGFNDLNQIVTKNFFDDGDNTMTNKLKLYPNPIASELNIDLEVAESTQITICTISEKRILEFTVKNHKNKLLLDKLNPGIYNVTVTNTAINKTFKIVKL
ncbi:MAG: DUF4832 domain-containing protein [Limnohabitans sp.]|nr:DUF4832 domain-containing protein [Limnohabitans sp.]